MPPMTYCLSKTETVPHLLSEASPLGKHRDTVFGF
jgi:hypothetical protein